MASTQPTGRVRVALAAAVMVTGVAGLLSGPAAAQTAATQTLGAGQFQTLDSPGIDCPGLISYPSVYLQTPAGRIQAGAQLDQGNQTGN